MNGCHNMVIYDQWPYMTMFGILEVVFIALREGIQIDRLLIDHYRPIPGIRLAADPNSPVGQVVTGIKVLSCFLGRW